MVYAIVIVTVIRLLELSWWQIIGLLVAVQVGSYAFDKSENKPLWRVGLDCTLIAGLVLAIGFMARYGLWGWILTMLMIAALILVTRWRQYMEILRRIETQIYGRPLDKTEWRDGEKPVFGRLNYGKK